MDTHLESKVLFTGLNDVEQRKRAFRIVRPRQDQVGIGTESFMMEHRLSHVVTFGNRSRSL